MEGSGLAEAMSVVYGPNTVKYIMKGAAYSKALRAQFLTDAALVGHIMGASNNTSLDDTLKDLQETSRTAKLWVLYHQLVRTVQEFILAERLHDWQGHLNVVGHGQYAKFGRLYLQEMLRLPEQYPQVSTEIKANTCIIYIYLYIIVSGSQSIHGGISYNTLLQ